MPLNPSPFAGSKRQTVSLSKAGHRYVFRYELGDEAAVIDHAISMVHDARFNFDWFDAGIITECLWARYEQKSGPAQ